MFIDVRNLTKIYEMGDVLVHALRAFILGISLIVFSEQLKNHFKKRATEKRIRPR